MIFVIGKSGYLGRSITDYLDDIELENTGIGRSDSVPVFGSDDTVINCASHGWSPGQREDIRETYKSNVLLVEKIQANRNGANLIHFGSGSEYVPEMYDSIYTITKREASKLLVGNAHVVYLYTIFGGRYEPSYRFMSSILKAAVKGERYTVTSPFVTRDFVHVDRLMPLVRSLIGTKDYQTIQFGTGNARTLAQVIGTLDAFVPNLKVSMQYVGANYFPYCAEYPYLREDNFADDLKGEYFSIPRTYHYGEDHE